MDAIPYIWNSASLFYYEILEFQILDVAFLILLSVFAYIIHYILCPLNVTQEKKALNFWQESRFIGYSLGDKWLSRRG